MSLLASLVRCFVILVGYAVASLAASAFLNVVMLAWFGFTAVETRMVATSSFVFSPCPSSRFSSPISSASP